MAFTDGGRLVSVPYSQGHRMRRSARLAPRLPSSGFQSPIHRVIGCDVPGTTGPTPHHLVSVPYSQGHRMRPTVTFRRTAPWMKVSVPYSQGHRMRLSNDITAVPGKSLVSVPYSQGHRMRLMPRPARSCGRSLFQSPIHRVIGCDRPTEARGHAGHRGFSPLFTGS